MTTVTEQITLVSSCWLEKQDGGRLWQTPYSNKATNGAVYQPVFIAVLEAVASVGLHVINVSSDMGSPKNVASFW